MKQKDILLVVVVSIVSAVLALVISSVTIGSSKNRQLKAEVVDKITDQFQQPDSKYFNDKSIDPTSIISIGENDTTSPFNNQQK